MESDAEDTKSQMTENQDDPSTTPTHKHKKKMKKLASVQATIQVLPENPERTPPLVGYFPSGFDPAKTQYSDSTHVGFFRDSKRPKRLQLVVTPDGSNVDFVGTSYTGEATTGQSCNYALGVLDKATQTLKIMPVVANKIFRLEPVVRGVDHDMEPASSGMGQITKQEMEDKQMELQKLFGTKKAIRENKKLRSLKQEADPEAQKVLDATIKQIVANKEAVEGTEGQSSRDIPPFNGSATTPEEAYPLDQIISQGEWDSLQNIYDLLQGGAEVSWDAFPSFVSNRIQKLQNIQDEAEKFKFSCIFSYITHLIKFKDQNSMEGISSAKGHKIPNILYHKFSSMFSSEAKRLSKDKTNLLISYVLVLTLFADEFHTDPTDIAKDLRIGPLPLKKLYEHLGCKFLRKSNLMIATLPVPLQFPQLRQRRKTRK